MRDDIRPIKKHQQIEEELDWLDQLFSDPEISNEIIQEEFKLEVDATFRMPSEYDLLEQDLVFEDKSKKEKKKKVLTFKKVKSQKIRSNKLFFSGLIGFFAACLALFIYSAVLVYPKLLKNVDATKGNIALLQKNISSSNSGGIAENLDSLAKQSNGLELSLQRMGQVIEIYSYMPGAKSSLTSKEISLTVANDLITQTKKRTDKFADQNRAVFSSSDKDVTFDFSELKASTNKYLIDLDNLLSVSLKKLSMTNSTDGTEMANMISSVKSSLGSINDFVLYDFDSIFGVSDQKKYLLLFQNNNELRGGSGGSLGSFGTVNFSEGKMGNLDFGKNIYKLDSEFAKKEQIAPPPELAPFKNWTMKQAGFAVDGKDALNKILWFYEKESGEDVNGVFSIDTSAVVDLLKITGPIGVPKYNQTITADNFVDTVQLEVQKSYFEREGAAAENEPKKIIGDMLPIFIDKLSSQIAAKGKNSLLIFASLLKSANDKNILVYFGSSDLQKSIDKFNITGAVTPYVGDYLYINNSNLGGDKTDSHMLQTSTLKVEIGKDGIVNNALKLVRKHNGSGVWPDGYDQDFVRVLMTSGTNLKKFDPTRGNFKSWRYDGYYPDGKSYEFTEEAGKSVSNFWMSTGPGEESEANMTYTPNYKIQMSNDFSYKLLLQHQPGAPKETVVLNLNYPEGYVPTNVANYSSKTNSLSLKFELTSDKEVVLHFKKM